MAVAWHQYNKVKMRVLKGWGSEEVGGNPPLLLILQTLNTSKKFNSKKTDLYDYCVG